MNTECAECICVFTEAWGYIETTRDLVRDLELRTQKCKDNVTEIQRIMATWNSCPLFERKADKHDPLLHIEDKETRLEKR